MLGQAYYEAAVSALKVHASIYASNAADYGCTADKHGGTAAMYLTFLRAKAMAFTEARLHDVCCGTADVDMGVRGAGGGGGGGYAAAACLLRRPSVPPLSPPLLSSPLSSLLPSSCLPLLLVLPPLFRSNPLLSSLHPLWPSSLRTGGAAARP
eukprot:3729845-Rhodomonas_salina.1